MRPDRDPPRLDESSDQPLVRQALSAARRDLPDADRMRMLSVGLAAKLGGGGGGGAPPDPGAPGAGGAGAAGAAAGSAAAPAAVKATGVALALALAGGAAWYATRPAPVEAPLAAPAAEVSPAAVAASEAPPVASAVPTFSFETLPTASAHVASSAPAASSSAPAQESEMAVLRRAQDALGSDPAGALALCGSHAHSFPRSSFGQEREVIAIDALIRLGRRAEAEARADRFAQSYPTSGHRRRIDSLLGR